MITGLAVEGLALSRGDRILFRDLEFSLAPGEAAALTGANGAGKTTLLRAIAGFVRPHAGAIRLTGPGEAPDLRAQGLHLIGHQDGLKSGRTAAEELGFQAAWAASGLARVKQAVEVLELERLLPLEVRKLSAGQRRRVALARLLAAPRPLWLLDEPLSPLDSHWRARLGMLMAAHLEGGGMILAAVHDPLPIDAKRVEIAG
jgi:heme exporter protein A